MSSQPGNTARTRRMMPPEIRARKDSRGEKLVCLTAYTAPMARLLDPHCDLLLVGDSLGMVLYGFENTLPVTLDLMIAHGRAVADAAHCACVIVDMPFGSFEKSPAHAFENASRILKETGAQGVKFEGGVAMAETISFLTSRGIPVMAHIGLMPQHVNAAGGYKSRGRSAAEQEALLADAAAVAGAGAFAVVLEGMSEPLAARISAECPVPTIGIGASAACGGQILVSEDMLGLSGGKLPRFVRRYADLAGEIDRAVSQWAEDVKAGGFPAEDETYR